MTYAFEIGDMVNVDVDYPTGLEGRDDVYCLDFPGVVIERFKVKGYPVYKIDISEERGSWTFAEEQLSLLIPDPTKKKGRR